MQTSSDATQHPLLPIFGDVLQHLADGGVAIVIAEQDTGRSRVFPTLLHDAIQQQVVVLEPSGFLAEHAVTGVSRFMPRVSLVTRSDRRADTRRIDTVSPSDIMFTTYGHALTSKLLEKTPVVVLDEAQRPSLDATLAKAVLKRRLDDNNPVSLVLMQSVVPSDKEMTYWYPHNPRVFKVADISTFSCDQRWIKDAKIADVALALVEEGRRGILVFVSTMKEITAVRQSLTAALLRRGSGGTAIDLVALDTSTGAADRAAAIAPPRPGVAKILIGTNVLEADLHLTWVDAGISPGTQRQPEMVRNSGALAMVDVPLTEALLNRQARLTSRFTNSTFVICSEHNPVNAPVAAPDEITRFPMTALVLRCAVMGMNPLEYDYQPSPEYPKLRAAVTLLRRLGLVGEDHRLTDAGQNSIRMTQIGPETIALLWHATLLDVLPQAMVLAAVFEVGSIRQERRESHGMDATSDFFDAALAFVEIYRLDSMDNVAIAERMAELNVDIRQFQAAHDVLRMLESMLNVKSNFVVYAKEDLAANAGTFAKLRQCLLAACLNRLAIMQPNQSRNVRVFGGNDTFYPVANGTVVPTLGATTPITAVLREVTPRKPPHRPFTVAEMITVHTINDFIEFDRVRPGVFEIRQTPLETTIRAFGALYFSQSARREYSDTPTPRPVEKSSAFPMTKRMTELDAAIAVSILLREKEKKTPPPVMMREEPLVVPSAGSAGPVTREALEALRRRFKGD
jgi:hypothetical protein